MLTKERLYQRMVEIKSYDCKFRIIKSKINIIENNLNLCIINKKISKENVRII